MILLNIKICSFPLRNLTSRTCLCSYGTLYISCQDMKNKYSYLNSKYQTSDTYSVFLKVNSTSEEVQECCPPWDVGSHCAPPPWYEYEGRGGPSPSQRSALLLSPATWGLLEGLPTQPHRFDIPQKPLGSHATRLASWLWKAALGRLSQHLSAASPLTVTLLGLPQKSRAVSIKKHSKTANTALSLHTGP